MGFLCIVDVCVCFLILCKTGLIVMLRISNEATVCIMSSCICLQLKNKRGRGKAESVVDGVVADTEVFTEELHVSAVNDHSSHKVLTKHSLM